MGSQAHNETQAVGASADAPEDPAGDYDSIAAVAALAQTHPPWSPSVFSADPLTPDPTATFPQELHAVPAGDAADFSHVFDAMDRTDAAQQSAHPAQQSAHPAQQSAPVTTMVTTCKTVLKDRVFLPFGLATGLDREQLKTLLAEQRATLLDGYGCNNFITMFSFLTHPIAMWSKRVGDLLSNVSWRDVLTVMSPVAAKQQFRGVNMAHGQAPSSADKAAYFRFQPPASALETRAMFMFRQGSMFLFMHPLLSVLQSLAFCGTAFLYGADSNTWKEFMRLAFRPIANGILHCANTKSFTTVVYRDCIDRFSRFILAKRSIRVPDGNYIAVVKRTGLAPTVNVVRTLDSDEGLVLFPLTIDQHGATHRAQPTHMCEAWSVAQVLYDTFAAAQYLLTGTRSPQIVFPTTPQHVRDALAMEQQMQRASSAAPAAAEKKPATAKAEKKPAAAKAEKKPAAAKAKKKPAAAKKKPAAAKKKTVAAVAKKKPAAGKRKAAQHAAASASGNSTPKSRARPSRAATKSAEKAKSGGGGGGGGGGAARSPNTVQGIVFLAPGRICRLKALPASVLDMV